MKVFFDTNVYIAEALLGEAAERLIQATLDASWRVYSSRHVLGEIDRVMVEHLRCSRRFATLTRRRAERRSTVVAAASTRHTVPGDPADSPILQAAIAAGVDYLVSNDGHLLALSPYEGLKIVSMSEYFRLLQDQSLLR